jgi:hypothetical protein
MWDLGEKCLEMAKPSFCLVKLYGLKRTLAQIGPNPTFVGKESHSQIASFQSTIQVEKITTM